MQEPVNNRSGLGLLSYLWNEWFSTFSILILLLLTLIIGTGDMIHGQMLRLGERLYGDEKNRNAIFLFYVLSPTNLHVTAM